MRRLSMRKFWKHFGNGTFGLLAVLVSAPTRAVDRLVPQQYPRIQAAIDAAVDGDAVLISPGKYLELLDIGNKRITVRGIAGAEQTIIDGTFLGVVIRIGPGATRDTRIEGLTISNGRSSMSAGGILVDRGAPTIIDNIIRGNLGGWGGHGVSLFQSAALLQRNRIIQNRSIDSVSGGGGGGGIAISGTCSTPPCGATEIINNLIADNRVTRFTDGGGIYITGGVVSIIGNVISGNLATSSGGGIALSGPVQARIESNLILGNSAPRGAGVYSYSSGAHIVGNTFIMNAVGTSGAELESDSFNVNTLTLANNIIVGDGLSTLVRCPAKMPVVRYNNLYNPGGNLSNGSCSLVLGSNGNVSENPMFTADGFSLAAGSPMIDRGETALSTSLIDLLGASRILDGNGDGIDVVDMGAVEFVDQFFNNGFEEQ
jgi:serine protease